MKCGTCSSECIVTFPVTARVFGVVHTWDECGLCYLAAQRRDTERQTTPTLPTKGRQ